MPETSPNRLLSPDQKYWVDISDLGNAAESKKRRRIETSFKIGKEKSFEYTHGYAVFLDGSRFAMGDDQTLVLFYLEEREVMHLTKQVCGEDVQSLKLAASESGAWTIVLTKRDGGVETLPLNRCLSLFRPGLGN